MNKTALALTALLSAACGAAAPKDAPYTGEADLTASLAAFGDVSDETGGERAQATNAPSQTADQSERKVIRTGSISVLVDSYGPFETELSAWLSGHGGQITSENVSHNAGEVGWSSLTLRVPSEDLDTLTSWLEETVEVTHLSVSSEDVTRTWVDLAARLDNARRTEGRLLGLLDTEAESLTDVLAVERELSRVRGDIESMEAQKRTLDSQIAMSTLSIDVAVQAPYQPVVSASFTDRIAAAFTGSLSTMGETGEAALLAGVAASPWLVVLGGGLWGIGQVRRRRMRPA